VSDCASIKKIASAQRVSWHIAGEWRGKGEKGMRRELKRYVLGSPAREGE